MNGDDIVKIVITSLLSSAISVVGTTAALKTDIRWIKDILMARPCMKNGKHCEED